MYVRNKMIIPYVHDRGEQMYEFVQIPLNSSYTFAYVSPPSFCQLIFLQQTFLSI